MCHCHEQHCGGECDCHRHRHGRHHRECDCECHEHACECERHGSGHHGHHDGGCDCGEHACECGGKFERRFATRAERIAQLEEYLKDLKAEIQAVEERLAELKAA